MLISLTQFLPPEVLRTFPWYQPPNGQAAKTQTACETPCPPAPGAPPAEFSSNPVALPPLELPPWSVPTQEKDGQHTSLRRGEQDCSQQHLSQQYFSQPGFAMLGVGRAWSWDYVPPASQRTTDKPDPTITRAAQTWAETCATARSYLRDAGSITSPQPRLEYAHNTDDLMLLRASHCAAPTLPIGTGLVAFTSFGFSPATVPVLVVPKVLLAQREGIFWLTLTCEVPDGVPAPALFVPSPAAPDPAEGNRELPPELASELAALRRWALQLFTQARRAPVAPLPVHRADDQTQVHQQWERAFTAAQKQLHAGTDGLRPEQKTDRQKTDKDGPQQAESYEDKHVDKVVLARTETYELLGTPREDDSPSEQQTPDLSTKAAHGPVLHAAQARLAATLQDHYPTCWTFAVGGLVGATPEMLIEAAGGQAHCRVLAGTAPVDEGPGLEASEKDAREHQIAVDSVTAPLRALLSKRREGTAVRTSERYLLHLPNVVHLATDVYVDLAGHGALPDGDLTAEVGAAPSPTTAAPRAALSVLTLAAALHPTAAVCGQPRDRAAQLIAQVEGAGRGRYAAPVGWVDQAGQGQLALALRCAQLDSKPEVRPDAQTEAPPKPQPENQTAVRSETQTEANHPRSLDTTGGQTGARRVFLRAWAGGGIMPNSCPETEWVETENKLSPIRSALRPQ